MALAKIGMNFLLGVDFVGLTEEETAAKVAQIEANLLARQELADLLSEMYKRLPVEGQVVTRCRNIRGRR